MHEKVSIPPKTARKLVLLAQGLHKANAFGKGKESAISCLQQLSYVQIDTISVVERAHNHTLWNRVADYRPEWTNELQMERRLFEYWSHAAALLPMDEFRFYLPDMEARHTNPSRWFQNDPKMLRLVLKRIKEEGPLKSSDFKTSKSSSGWWEWKPSKHALEQLFFAGKLMVSHRVGFQKVYDLAERVLPAGLSLKKPSQAEWMRFRVNKAVASQGLMTLAEIAYMRARDKAALLKAALQLCETGELCEVTVVKNSKSADGQSYFASSKLLEQVSNSSIRLSSYPRLLSPFDNLVIQRDRARNLFDFDYQIECYVPAAKRKFGYFTLPFLIGASFRGRADLKAVRKDRILEVRNLVLEKGVRPDSTLPLLAKALADFGRFNDCPAIKVVKTTPAKLASPLRKLLS